ncbi:hypothetical protein LCGC14_1449370 [marine sediment metagenome]|uniref:Uncharacterized protein n=1 Tax=marine sediment metagenome TaxID=412755 RepID=A0A0F9MK75_9ZZZZ
MSNIFKRFFKNNENEIEKEVEKEMKAVRYGELRINWTAGPSSVFSVIFYEDDNGKREYRVNGRDTKLFDKTDEYAQCETWKHTGLFPDWAKDPIAEKLSR